MEWSSVVVLAYKISGIRQWLLNSSNKPVSSQNLRFICLLIHYTQDESGVVVHTLNFSRSKQMTLELLVDLTRALLIDVLFLNTVIIKKKVLF